MCVLEVLGRAGCGVRSLRADAFRPVHVRLLKRLEFIPIDLTPLRFGLSANPGLDLALHVGHHYQQREPAPFLRPARP